MKIGFGYGIPQQYDRYPPGGAAESYLLRSGAGGGYILLSGGGGGRILLSGM